MQYFLYSYIFLGCPAIATGVWFYLKLSVSHSASLADDGSDGINIQRLLSYCPIYKEDNIDLYSYDLLVLCLLIVNSFFLFWIMGVSLKKNYSSLAKLYLSDCFIQATISNSNGP